MGWDGATERDYTRSVWLVEPGAPVEETAGLVEALSASVVQLESAAAFSRQGGDVAFSKRLQWAAASCSAALAALEGRSP